MFPHQAVRTLATLFLLLLAAPVISRAQSPELSLREFASSQIKKGVRTLGMGGDGATHGNYGLVWKEAGTAIADYGQTEYSNGNRFDFAAVGATLPPMWKDIGIYFIAIDQGTNDLTLKLGSPGLGTGKTSVTGSGRNEGLFSKIAMPLGNGVSAGVLISHEISSFDAIASNGQRVRYQTEWRPSGGLGLAWQVNPDILVGTRMVYNQDWEKRTDATGTREGLASSQELRLGASYAPWPGGIVDYGRTHQHKTNAVNATEKTISAPNFGIEQSFFERRFALRMGKDESANTFGFSVRRLPLALDVVYVKNIGMDRIGTLFGDRSRSLIMTVTWHYDDRKQAH